MKRNCIIDNAVILMLLLLMMVTVTGCMNVDYVGQSFPPMPEDSAVAVYSPSVPPPENMRAIGRVYVTAPQGTSTNEISDELIELAREKGAEAVNIVESKRVNIGSAAPGLGRGSSPSWNRDNRNAGGAYIYSNSFGDVMTMEQPTAEIIETQVKALLLVSESRFEQIKALYQEERRKLEAAAAEHIPAPAATAEEALDKAAVKIAPAAGAVATENKTEKSDEKVQVKVNLTKENDVPVTL